MRRLGLVLSLATSACSLVWPYDEIHREGSAGGSADGGTGTRPSWAPCPKVGWCDLGPDTVFVKQCPTQTVPYDYPANCPYVIDASNSAIADTTNDLMVIWGGGGQYAGNEVYTLSLGDHPRLERRNDPDPYQNCVEVLDDGSPDGSPASHTTFDGLSYIEPMQQLFAFGGDKYCDPNTGGGSDKTWTLDLHGASAPRWKPDWTLVNAPPPAGVQPFGPDSDYDAASNSVLVLVDNALLRYDVAKKSYARVTTEGGHYNMTGRVDPATGCFVSVGCAGCDPGVPTRSGLKVFCPVSAESYTAEQHTEAAMPTCQPLLEAGAPGFAYDPVLHRFIGWPNQGSAVWALDVASDSCKELDLPGGPPAGDAMVNTRGRFRYFPKLGVFVLLPSSESHAFALRLPDTL